MDNMDTSLERDEQVILFFNVAFNPGLFKINKKKACLTNKRLIVYTKPETSVYFSSINDIDLLDWQGSGKIIELDCGQKISFNVIYAGGTNNEKTVVLFNWLKDLKGQREMPEYLVTRIKSESHDFYKNYSIFGVKLDMSKPHSWLAAGVLLLGILFGGALGAGISFLLATFIMKVGSNEDYSGQKKWAYIIASLIGGAIIYLLLASIFLAGINVVFPKKITPEEQQFNAAASTLKVSRENLNAAMRSEDYATILAAVETYNNTVHQTGDIFVSGCKNKEISGKNADLCPRVELVNRCNKRDAMIVHTVMKLGYAPQTMTKEECSAMVVLMNEQDECGTLDKSYLVDQDSRAKIQQRCEEL